MADLLHQDESLPGGSSKYNVCQLHAEINTRISIMILYRF